MIEFFSLKPYQPRNKKASDSLLSLTLLGFSDNLET